MIQRLSLVTVLAFGIASAALAAGSASNSTRQPQPSSAYDLGVKAVQSGDYTGALRALKKAVNQDPGNANAWNYIGFSHRNLKQFDKSLNAYQKALSIDPSHRGANEYLGELYLMMGNLEKANERLEKLDKLCAFGCKEYDELKAAIKAHGSG